MTTISSFPLDEFPACPSYGFNAQPQYLVKVNAREGGFESVKKRWPRPITFYTAVPVGARDQDDIRDILNFWHCMKGRATTFRFKDWTDYKSCQVQQSESATDQPLLLVSDSTGDDFYQLQKQYAFGMLTQVRDITQPIGDSLLVANEVGVLQDPSTYIVDESLGLLSPTADFDGVPTSWGGQFMVPVRFDSELTIEVSERAIQSVSFTIKEKREILETDFDIPDSTVPVVFTARSALATAGSAAILASGNGVILGASGTTGNIIRSTNDGVSWAAALTGAANNITALASNETITTGTGTTFLAGAANSKVYRSTDGGVTWSSAISVGSIGAIRNIVYETSSSPNRWLAIGDDGAHYAASTDDGLTWGLIAASIAFLPATLHFSGASLTYFALADVAGVLNLVVLTTLGGSWGSPTPIGAYATTTKGLGFDPHHGEFMVGGGASKNVRTAFVVTNLPSGADHPVTFTGADTAISAVSIGNAKFFAFGDQGSVSNSDDGTAWAHGTLNFSGTNAAVASVYNQSTGNLLVASAASDVSVAAV